LNALDFWRRRVRASADAVMANSIIITVMKAARYEHRELLPNEPTVSHRSCSRAKQAGFCRPVSAAVSLRRKTGRSTAPVQSCSSPSKRANASTASGASVPCASSVAFAPRSRFARRMSITLVAKKRLPSLTSVTSERKLPAFRANSAAGRACIPSSFEIVISRETETGSRLVRQRIIVRGPLPSLPAKIARGQRECETGSSHWFFTIRCADMDGATRMQCNDLTHACSHRNDQGS